MEVRKWATSRKVPPNPVLLLCGLEQANHYYNYSKGYSKKGSSE